MVTPRVRYGLGIALLAMLAAGAIRPIFVKLLFVDRQALYAIYSSDPDKYTLEYPRFLEEVARRTKEGESIAIVVPMRRWDGGYSYAYYRASWFLAGRRVLPLVWRDDRLIEENARKADWVAAWRLRVGGAGLEQVWSGHGGMLMRQVKR